MPLRLLLFDVRVQGDLAAPEIAKAIKSLSRDGSRHGIEAIILTRGGGSIEDLWAFNERIVADALFECSLPVVAAIGHETDTTVAELVADVRCSTPTQAAMTLIPDRESLDHQVRQLSHRLVLVAKRNLQQSRQGLRAIARHPIFRRPEHMFDIWRQRLDGLSGRLVSSVPQSIESKREKLEALKRQLDAVGPANVLQRGYTYTLMEDGHVLRSREQAKPDERITTVLADGKVISRVESSKPVREASKKDRPKSHAAQADQAAQEDKSVERKTSRKKRSSGPPSPDKDQASLF